MVARYLSGFKPSIQDILGLRLLWMVSEAYKSLVGGEATKPKWCFKAGSFSNDGKGGDLDGKLLRTNKFRVSSSNQANPNRVGAGKQFLGVGFKCLKCGEPSH
jgi:hypothetical protein